MSEYFDNPFEIFFYISSIILIVGIIKRSKNIFKYLFHRRFIDSEEYLKEKLKEIESISSDFCSIPLTSMKEDLSEDDLRKKKK